MTAAVHSSTLPIQDGVADLLTARFSTFDATIYIVVVCVLAAEILFVVTPIVTKVRASYACMACVTPGCACCARRRKSHLMVGASPYPRTAG